jgi:hypothetical protein
MKFFLVFLLGLFQIILFKSAIAGVFGVGNSGDLSIQLQFAKTNALTFIKIVTPENLKESSNNDDLFNLYRQCRETMLVSAIKTEFELVDVIPDGGEYHAVMRRNGSNLQVSRTMMEYMAKQGLFTAQAISAHFIHEMAHDCIYNGKPVDDSFDPLLDKLGETIIRTASSQSISAFRSFDFTEKVKNKEPVLFISLPAEARRQITKAYLDYIGDWAFINFGTIQSLNTYAPSCNAARPAPASQFYANSNTSVFPGWAYFDPNEETLKVVSEKILKPSYQTKSLSFSDGTSNKPSPTQMTCLPTKANHLSASVCTLNISWSTLKNKDLQKNIVSINLTMDLIGNLEINKITVQK